MVRKSGRNREKSNGRFASSPVHDIEEKVTDTDISCCPLSSRVGAIDGKSEKVTQKMNNNDDRKSDDSEVLANIHEDDLGTQLTQRPSTFEGTQPDNDYSDNISQSTKDTNGSSSGSAISSSMDDLEPYSQIMIDKRKKRKGGSLLKKRNKKQGGQPNNVTDDCVPTTAVVTNEASVPADSTNNVNEGSSLPRVSAPLKEILVNEERNKSIQQIPAKKKRRRVAQKHSLSSQEQSSQSSTETHKKLSTSSSQKPNQSSHGTKSKTTEQERSSSSDILPPPKKKKFNYQDQILHHLLITAKPYTLKSLAQSTRSTEEALNSVMLSLIDKELVFKKEFVTQKRTKVLYWANQEASSSTSKDVLKISASPDDVRAASEELGRWQRQYRATVEELGALLKHPTNDRLGDIVTAAQEELTALQQQIEELKRRIADAEKCAGKNDPKRLKKKINKMRSEWKQRKEKCNDFVDILADAMEKRIKDVLKLLETETDEMMGVKMPPKYFIHP
mmetsp:Transcript_23162/g.28421  ORF Transcript_23162/g.28421 Transcript_23162/m.28421 type:complete len:503 (+) Transcript_23162:191-1699(+)